MNSVIKSHLTKWRGSRCKLRLLGGCCNYYSNESSSSLPLPSAIMPLRVAQLLSCHQPRSIHSSSRRVDGGASSSSFITTRHERWTTTRPLPSSSYRSNAAVGVATQHHLHFSTVSIDDDFDTTAHNDNNRHCQTCTCPDDIIINKERRRSSSTTTTHNNATEELKQQQQQNQQQKEEQSKLSSPHTTTTTTTTTTPTTITCHQSNGHPLVPPNTPLPPPLPSPNYSFHTRVLPSNLTAFSSPHGKHLFLTSLQTLNAEAYFPLSQQFLNQSDPAYCGISTLILVLNALAMDPNVRWRGGWRWYGNESMLLERCCIEEERVSREGVTMEMYCGLARCQGVGVVMKRPVVVDDASLENDGGDGEDCNGVSHDGNDGDGGAEEQCYGLEEFRRDVITAVQNPPRTQEEETDLQQQAPSSPSSQHQQQPLQSNNTNKSAAATPTGGYFLVTSFARHTLQQTGAGHFSPIAAYHPPTDSCLVLDVARFKYAPYWVSVEELYEAMKPVDESTGRSRGWILMYPPNTPSSNYNHNHNNGSDNDKGNTNGKQQQQQPKKSREELEGKRPVACVPLAGSGVSICPVEKIKVDYCSVGKK